MCALGAAFLLGGAMPVFAGASTGIGPSAPLTKTTTLDVPDRTKGEKELTGILRGAKDLTASPARVARREPDGSGPLPGLPELPLPKLPLPNGGAPLRTRGAALPEDAPVGSLRAAPARTTPNRPAGLDLPSAPGPRAPHAMSGANSVPSMADAHPTDVQLPNPTKAARLG